MNVPLRNVESAPMFFFKGTVELLCPITFLSEFTRQKQSVNSSELKGVLRSTDRNACQYTGGESRAHSFTRTTRQARHGHGTRFVDKILPTPDLGVGFPLLLNCASQRPHSSSPPMSPLRPSKVLKSSVRETLSDKQSPAAMKKTALQPESQPTRQSTWEQHAFMVN